MKKWKTNRKSCETGEAGEEWDGRTNAGEPGWWRSHSARGDRCLKISLPINGPSLTHTHTRARGLRSWRTVIPQGRGSGENTALTLISYLYTLSCTLQSYLPCPASYTILFMDSPPPPPPPHRFHSESYLCAPSSRMQVPSIQKAAYQLCKP